MRSIGNLIRSIANLAGSVNNLANFLDAFTGRLRMQLALDEASTVLDHAPAGGDNDAPDGSTSGTGKGRKAKTGVA